MFRICLASEHDAAYTYKSSVDVLSQYVASMKKAGIGHGFYYSISGIPEAGNVYLANLNVTGAQLRQIQIEHHQVRQGLTKQE